MPQNQQEQEKEQRSQVQAFAAAQAGHRGFDQWAQPERAQPPSEADRSSHTASLAAAFPVERTSWVDLAAGPSWAVGQPAGRPCWGRHRWWQFGADGASRAVVGARPDDDD